MGITESNEMDLLVCEMFEKAEALMSKSDMPMMTAADFMLTLACCMGIFHESHYLPEKHEELMQEFARKVVEKAELHRAQNTVQHFHIQITIDRNKK